MTEAESQGHDLLSYGGGKWGRYLRAPDFYFEIMEEFGHRFTRLGEVATIKRGITSGCDAFFMPRNVSAELLEKHQTELEWHGLPLMKRCRRAEVETGKIVIVRCGDGTLHPIEADFVRPEVHSLMQVDRPIVEAEQLDRVVLWVKQTLDELKGTYVHHFISWGAKQTFASSKSKSVPIPLRATCAARSPWYDLTGLAPGIGFWPKSQQYRHIVPANHHGLICNCNLYDIHVLGSDSIAIRALMPILNCTMVAFFKPFYGRYAGTEGNLKTEVVDALLLEIPDPSNVSRDLLKQLESAFGSMQQRKVTHLVEEVLMDCHTAEEVREAAKHPLSLSQELQEEDRHELDDAVFQFLGVTHSGRRQQLISQLYREVSLHFRSIRIVEVQKMEQRRRGGRKDSVSQMELAQDAWNNLEPELRKPLSTWLTENAFNGRVLSIPEGEVRLAEPGHLFEPNTLYFGKKSTLSHIECANRAEAELLFSVAQAGLRGSVPLPSTESETKQLQHKFAKHLGEGRARLEELAEERAGTEKLRFQILEILHRWFIHGKSD